MITSLLASLIHEGSHYKWEAGVGYPDATRPDMPRVRYFGSGSSRFHRDSMGLVSAYVEGAQERVPDMAGGVGVRGEGFFERKWDCGSRFSQILPYRAESRLQCQ